MAIPSGSGSEVLKVNYVVGLTNSSSDLIVGVTNHIYTVISIIFGESNDTAETLQLTIKDSDDSNQRFIMYGQAIPAQGTYVWNDRFVISGNKKLVASTTNAANIDVIVSYIDQDWT